MFTDSMINGMSNNGSFEMSLHIKRMERAEFIKNEYTALKREILERIRILNSQASNAVAAVLSSWSMAIALIVVCYSDNVANEITYRFALENIKNGFF